MLRINRILVLMSAVAALGLAPERSLGQPRTEVRDPVRGVSFSSIELSNMPLNSLDVVEGTFADSDRLAVGLSALVFDGSPAVDEYVFWVRHEGRRWLDFEIGTPVVIEVDGEALSLERLRASQPFVGGSNRLFEKIEFRLTDAELERLLDASSVLVRLRADNGVVDKRLTDLERDRLREFYAELTSRR